MEAENLIAADAKAAGININPTHPAYATVVNDRKGYRQRRPDLRPRHQQRRPDRQHALDVLRLHLPPAEIAAGPARNRNYEQYANAAAWDLVQKLDQTPTDDMAAMQTICSQLQKIQLTDEPVIPLWYNGEWSQVNNSVWTNWPSSTGNSGSARHVERLLADGSNLHAHRHQGRHARQLINRNYAPPSAQTRGEGPFSEFGDPANRRSRATLLRAKAIHLL